jgi:ADP-heptose:LPS heptosyltransferase
MALPKDGYFIVFPGSRSSARIWDTGNFIELSNYLYQKYKLTAIVCGGQGDIIYAERFIQAYSNPVINITAKTSLPELLSIIKNAACLLSVDTGSIHLAAAVDCLALGIFNGSQYGRFSPYPKEISSKIISFYPKQVLEDINKNALSKYELISTISYNDVSPNEVINYLNSYPLQEGTC